MKYLSVCSGIEAASVAWQPLGWEPVAFSEIEPFPRSVLKHHYPHVPNWGDMTKYQEWPDANVDLLCGGTPCQSFSIAGLRKGLDDPRGNLMLTFGAIAARYRPRWLVWENVPGVLSSNQGRDFGAFLGMLAQLGYGFAYRVLDAQYVRVQSHPRAVPQRRRRVFVVGHSGGLWQRAAAVLFERESLRRHPAPRRQAGSATAALTARCVGTCGADDNQGQARHLIPEIVEPSATLNASMSKGKNGQDLGALVPVIVGQAMCSKWTKGTSGPAGDEHHNLLPVYAMQAGCTRENPGSGPEGMGIQTNHAYTLEARSEQQIVASPLNVAMRSRSGVPIPELGGNCANALSAAAGGSSRSHALTPDTTGQWSVRRLTPLECERLMGFPDGYTAVPFRGKPASDAARYKALGNSWAVNCARWIGERIAAVDAITNETRSAE